MLKTQKIRGFTIVELLIVIVVIAILAAISIVAYNGIQTRAENTKTVNAVNAWVKAIEMYRAELGAYPTINSCFGSTSTYASANNNRCWSDSNSGWVVQPSFVTAMSPYISNQPEPSTRNVSSETFQRRGALYLYSSSTDVRVYIAHIGFGPCPAIGGLQPAFATNATTSGNECIYRFPQ